ncbi:MAG: cytochrome c oxidase subunit II [Pirellulales bacterium]
MTERGFQLFPDQASSFAPRVDALYTFLVIVSAFFTLLIFLAIVFLAVRYRRSAVRDRKRRVGAKFWVLEAVWIVIPLALTMIMFLWGAALHFDQRIMPRDAIELNVVGKQWMWKIQHPQGRSEINELHVPLGRPILLRMISEDVIHSFYLPAFRVKMDVLPDRYHALWFEATQPGVYHLFCAEYCGTEHADMRGFVYVMQPSEYATWLAGGEQQPPVTAGEALFTRFRCDTCHYQGGQPRCPSLANLFGQPVRLSDGQIVSAEEQYIRESILNPAAKVVAGYQPIMPIYEGQLSEEQVFHLIEYIKSLSVMPPETGQPAPVEEPAQGFPADEENRDG